MKIAFLSRYQKNIHRGAESFVMELSKRLSKNHNVEIFSGSDSDSLSRILHKNFDVVISINGRLQALKASLGRLIGGYKLLISGHSGIGRDDIWNIALVRPDVFVTLTEFQKKWAGKFSWGVKLTNIPDGVDVDKFTQFGDKIKLDLEPPIILSVGALEWYKYHERVIKAIGKLSNVALLIVGQGSKREELFKLGQKLLGKRFKLMNFEYKDMPKVYRSCDLFTLPSWDREAFGIVYLEAMASGLGIVAPNDESRREIIGDAGLFVDASNIEKYSKVLEQSLSIDWSTKAIKQAEKFSWDRVAKSYEDLLNSMIKK